jgi:triphosphoribosyl-dephospho-CoA synthase
VSRVELIGEAFESACLAELAALKPGNVHAFADGHQLTRDQFVRSADAATAPLAARGARVGRRILDAVAATHLAVGTNTNLGIILLCAPLAAAAETDRADLRSALAAVLDELDTADADLAFRAIVRASPAGLGRVPENDVNAPARVTLRDAMADAAHRDRVARQYVTAYADIFEHGLSRRAAAAARGWAEEWAISAVYLGFLADVPDSHIVRKYGIEAAENVRQTAGEFHARLQSAWDPSRLTDDLLAWDAALKADGINPGTSADLTVATVFAHRLATIRLATILPSERNSG